MVQDKNIDENVLKTGTTTVAFVCNDGVILAADKRVTSGYLISYKTFEKVVQISDNLAVTVAGTVSDVQLLIKYLKAELKLKEIRTNKQITVKEAANLLSNFIYSNIRKMSMIPGISHFVLGGTDPSGFHLYDLSPDGSMTQISDFVSSGSGSVYAIGVLETLYKPNMTVKEGLQLAAKAINAAVQRDIASGNGCDIVSITKDGVKKELSQVLDYKIEA